ncbi:MAG: hypothetical protein ACE5I5_16600 [Candidatus Heimdallarchaeota archaeon]
MFVISNSKLVVNYSVTSAGASHLTLPHASEDTSASWWVGCHTPNGRLYGEACDLRAGSLLIPPQTGRQPYLSGSTRETCTLELGFTPMPLDNLPL